LRSGIAYLPLHGGRAPRWLFDRMKKLARYMVIAFVEEWGPELFLQRVSDPFWFQAFGCVLGFDWHSSGLTVTTTAAIKEGIKGMEKELGLFIAGGKGKRALKTPDDIRKFGEAVGVDAEKLVYISRMVAKVDSSALQDGYQLYHHAFFFSSSGNWAIVQQGMNASTLYARRYHWLKDNVKSFVEEPHKAIVSDRSFPVLNMVAKDSRDARNVVVGLASEKPEKLLKEIKAVRELKLPSHHYVVGDVNPDKIYKGFLAAYEQNPKDFEELLVTKNVGPKTIRALALISEVLYGAPPSFADPARFSFAHGGKDGYPYPVDRGVYDNSIEVLMNIVRHSRLSVSEKGKALRRLQEVTKGVAGV